MFLRKGGQTVGSGTGTGTTTNSQLRHRHKRGPVRHSVDDQGLRHSTSGDCKELIVSG